MFARIKDPRRSKTEGPSDRHPYGQIGAAQGEHDQRKLRGSERRADDYWLSSHRVVTFWVEGGKADWNLGRDDTSKGYCCIFLGMCKRA